MRLWHKSLIPVLPTMQLLGQHRECAAMRGNGWGRNHRTVNYVWKYRFEYLVQYHHLVMKELEKRVTVKGSHYHIKKEWWSYQYRGRHRPNMPEWGYLKGSEIDTWEKVKEGYPEHDWLYLIECMKNIKEKIEKAPPEKYPSEEVKRFKEYMDIMEIPF